MPLLKRVVCALALVPFALKAQPPCTFPQTPASFNIHHVKGEPALTLDPNAAIWRNASETVINNDCHKEIAYEDAHTNVRGFWTDKYAYFLFECRYKELNLFLPASNAEPRYKLWDRDVVELFIGSDWKDINHYREYEVAPTNDWIDLAIDLNKGSFDWHWRSHWQTMARIDEANKTWYAALRIPLVSVTSDPVHAGDKWRMNLFRIDGKGTDKERHFMCWQPICTPDHPSNHTPAHFGALGFEK